MDKFDFCNVTRQIAKFPYEDVKTWGILTVGNMLDYKSHMEGCFNCQEIMDAVIEEHKDEFQRPDPSSLN
jgi:hypothetical protein